MGPAKQEKKDLSSWLQEQVRLKPCILDLSHQMVEFL